MSNLFSDLVKYRLLFQLILVLGMGGSFQNGFYVAVINAPSLYIKRFINDTWQNRYNSTIDEKTLTLFWSSVVSVYSVGGLVGSLMTEHLTGKFGKMKCQMWKNIVVLVGALLMSFCRMADSFEMILLGRLLYGFSAGIGMNIHVQYLGEIAPKTLRGFTTASSIIFITAGKLTAQILGLSEILGTESWWHLLLAISGITALIQLVTLPCFPETPQYLLMQKGDLEGCMKAMKQLWGDEDHQGEIDNLLKEKALRKTVRQMTLLGLLRDKSLRWQLYCTFSLSLTFQLSGINAIYFYTYDVFHTAGFSLEETPYLTIGVGTLEAVGSVLCSLLVERMGRKILLLSSYGFMATIMGVLTVIISLKDHYSWISYCNLMLIFLFVFFSGIALGTTGVLCCEMFTQSSRAAATMICGSLSWTGMYLIAVIFPFIVESMGQFCFLVFLGCIAPSWIFYFLYLPETRNKSSMEIMEEFNKLNFGSDHTHPTSENPQVTSEKCSRL